MRERLQPAAYAQNVLALIAQCTQPTRVLWYRLAKMKTLKKKKKKKREGRRDQKLPKNKRTQLFSRSMHQKHIV